MGKVRTGSIKRLARTLLQLHPELFTADFESNKQALKQFEHLFPSKRVRNKVAGYITRLVKLRLREQAKISGEATSEVGG